MEALVAGGRPVGSGDVSPVEVQVEGEADRPAGPVWQLDCVGFRDPPALTGGDEAGSEGAA